MLSWVLFTLFILAVLVAAYVMILRPVLKRIPDLAPFYAEADGFWAKLNVTFTGFRTLALAKLQVVIGWALTVHEVVAAILQQLAPTFGALDWTPLSTRLLSAAGVPPDLQPMAMFVLGSVAVAVLGHVHAMLRKATTGPVGEPVEVKASEGG
ncbi:hypothetical protein PQJ75_00580 [Rhodoplanes sp. TEM]|uniref:Uncharacterized protein n=1 Tax=Rhodoplanes tepidamans TaxID=200616 RepID=A0ABT5J5N5_RHOTP|nr:MULTISPECIES: hypothetical protein [Rhodoplanes]MDC7784747.1 hypothetical protein [Rhodoplanes tepidamans]MDC7982214.1 hypothetical protein [Rhodoplanes sp. TEM]MDQ0356219.1 hypothetical protein [Rhodoplanes tepidamans]